MAHLSAHPVDNSVQLGRRLRVFYNRAVESETHGIEERPGGAVPPLLVHRLRELRHHIWRPLYVDNPFAVEVEDSMVGLLFGEHGLSVASERPGLRLTMKGQRLYQLPIDTGKIPLQVGGVLPLGDLIGDEREIVADKDS